MCDIFGEKALRGDDSLNLLLFITCLIAFNSCIKAHRTFHLTFQEFLETTLNPQTLNALTATAKQYKLDLNSPTLLTPLAKALEEQSSNGQSSKSQFTKELSSKEQSIEAILEALILKYERNLNSETVHRKGAIYTPISVAQEMIRLAVSYVDASTQSFKESFTVLDPAVGAGVFPLAFIELYKDKQLPFKGLPTILGYDRDPQSLDMAKMIHLSIEPEAWGKITHQYTTEDFLLNSSSDQTYDLIIGNPPYGLARGGKISPEENLILKETFKEYRSGKVDKYMLFMAKAFSLLSPQGVLSFIVPNSWLGIDGGLPLRKKILDNGSLCEVIYPTEKIFEDPSVEPVIFILKKNAQRRSFTVSRSLNRVHRTEVNAASCLNNPSFRIPLCWSSRLDEFFEALKKNTVSLDSEDSPLKPLIALQAYATGKGSPPQTIEDVKNHIFHTKKKDRTTIPYLQGEDVDRFSVDWSGEYLRYGPWLSEHQPRSRYEGPRVLVREILGTVPYLLKASFIEESYAYNRSILHILPKDEGQKELLQTVSCVLNSKFASCIIAYQGRKSQRQLFPKIVNGDLQEFPIPIKRDVSTLTKLLFNKECIGEEFELAVLDFYGLSSKFVTIIDKALEEFPFLRRL